jgi:hypothetical protein
MKYSDSELRALLPWYINKTLCGEARVQIRRYAARSALVASEIAWLGQLRGHIRLARVEADRRPADAGLQKVMALVSGEKSGKVLRFGLRVRERVVAWSQAPRRFSVPFGIAAVLVLAQAVVIGVFLDGRNDSLVPLSGQRAVEGTVIQLTFRPEATEAQIRVVVASVRGDIISGPGALGVYSIRVPEDQRKAALVRLNSSRRVVESAVLVQGR